MPISINAVNGLRKQYLAKHLNTTVASLNGTGLSERQINNVKKWVSRYRRNWDLFVKEVFQIHLYPIQEMKVHMMGVGDTYFDISTRGSAKSFLVGIGALCAFCLYSYSEIVITSSTISQASKLVEKKIRDEIIKKLSPYLLYLYQHEYITITKSATENGTFLIENKLNGSKIIVVPCLDSSRGERATMVILEEARLLKKTLIDSIFLPMLHTRPAKYLTNKKYQTSRWLSHESGKTIYITSARYKYEWFFREFKNTVTSYYTSRHEKYIPFAEDIFTAIEEGSRTWADYRKNKKVMGQNDFRCEILNEMIGEAEDSFFNYKEFKENQIISQAFVPPTTMDIYMDKDLGNPAPEHTELRLVGIDYAFANTTGGTKNDKTQMICMSLHWKKNHFERHVDYLEEHEASDSIGANNRFRELLWDYSMGAEFYGICDLRSGGETIFNRMTMPWEHPERGNLWDSRGFTIASNERLHVVPDTKLADLTKRTVDKNAVPCIIPIIGTPELNSSCWVSLKKNLEFNNIKFLIPAEAKQEEIEDNGIYYNLSSEQLANVLYPHILTENLIQEAVALNAEIRDNRIRLYENRNNTKDLVVVLAYLNYIADKLENEWNKYFYRENNSEDYGDIQLIY